VQVTVPNTGTTIRKKPDSYLHPHKLDIIVTVGKQKLNISNKKNI
jgi:hypothetical protein